MDFWLMLYILIFGGLFVCGLLMLLSTVTQRGGIPPLPPPAPPTKRQRLERLERERRAWRGSR